MRRSGSQQPTRDHQPRARATSAIALLAGLALVLAACGAPSAPPATGPTSVSVTPSTAEIGEGATIDLEARADGVLTTAVTWSSGDEGVASVDASGTVTGVEAGTTTVTATSTVASSVSGNAEITVVGCEPPTTVDGNVTSDTTWTAQGFGCPDYVVTDFIDVSAALDVEAGTVVLFEQDAGLRIRAGGSLVVAGTADERVRFAGTDSTAGWWRGIEMWRSGDLTPSRIDHAIIEHAGRPGADGEGYTLQLGTPDTTDVSDVNVIDVTNTLIRDGGGYGLRATRFSQVPAFANVTITGHAQAPVWVSARNSGFLDGASDLTGNGDDVVRIEGDEAIAGTGQVHAITEPITWVRLASDVPYRFDGAARVTAALTVEPGVTVEFVADGELRVTDGGSLVADGTSAAPITFTGTERVRGHWYGIFVWRTGEDPQSVLDHVTIEYAGGEREAPDFDIYGYNLVLGSPTTDPTANATLTTLTNTTLRQSAGYGLYVSHGSTFVTNGFANNVLSENALGAAHVSAQAARSLDAGTSYEGNDEDLVLLDANDGRDDVTEDATWPTLGEARYVVSGTIDLRAVLTLEPGVTLSFEEDTGIFAYTEDAGLVADGTSTNPIRLTGEVAQGGSWYGVYLREARMAGNVMDHVTIEYGGGEYDGGATGWVSNERFNLSVGQIPSNTAQMTITNSTFRDAGVPGSGFGRGLYVGPDSAVNADVCTVNTFVGNQQGCLVDD